ncbi:MAG: hypothetical protein CMO01_14630 [Thalassobius sp.]|nr:hypothetical protein [Thalassovita sp.]
MQRNKLIHYSVSTLKLQPLFHRETFCKKIVKSLKHLVDSRKINLYGFVILPTKVECLWELKGEESSESPHVQFLRQTSVDMLEELRKKDKKTLDLFCIDMLFHKIQFWQRGPRPVVIQSYDEAEAILDKMHYDAGRLRLSDESRTYPYSSNKFYKYNQDNFDILSHYNEYFGKRLRSAS